MTSFALDPRLAQGSVALGDGPLSRVLLVDDARFPWLMLVPRRSGLRELIDLLPGDRAALSAEIDRAARVLQAAVPCDKLNVGALGNMVEQLHVHVVARRRGDEAWPGTIWGAGTPRPHDPGALAVLAARLRKDLDL